MARLEDGEHDVTARENPPTVTLYGVVVGVLYVLAVGVQAFLIADEVTHGRLTDDVARRWRELTARMNERRRLERTMREQTPWVLWDAHEALEQEGAP